MFFFKPEHKAPNPMKNQKLFTAKSLEGDWSPFPYLKEVRSTWNS